ncbi:PhzF family phenazine biosynthesis isomerase [Actinoplanes sp. NPDC049118]|uniref:PhzF family phenazine biosynthesis protein n=1 Tax=Actinoplanes sp. NPDC049118 TaxID=3155769 RepID=UPI0033F0D278
MAVVDACTRDGRGGSPTAVVIDDDALTDGTRRAIVHKAGTSHAAFLGTGTDGVPAVRFFTTAGELRNCGHGTIAAQAFLLERGGAGPYRGRQRTGGRTFATRAVRRRDGVEVWFDQGVVELRDRGGADGDGIVTALGLAPRDLAGDLRIASPGTPRLLVGVRGRRALLSMRPDLDRLAAECRRLGWLGCFAFALSPGGTTADARMFAPAIGVDEDLVNANSAGCLAAHLLSTGRGARIEVRQGDALGRPCVVHAAATGTRAGIAVRIGGTAAVRPPA